MVRPTHDEIIRELTRELTVLRVQVERIQEETADLPNLTIKVALLEQQVADLRKGWELWIQRLWMVLAPFVGAGVGAILTYWLNKK